MLRNPPPKHLLLLKDRPQLLRARLLRKKVSQPLKVRPNVVEDVVETETTASEETMATIMVSAEAVVIVATVVVVVDAVIAVIEAATTVAAAVTSVVHAKMPMDLSLKPVRNLNLAEPTIIEVVAEAIAETTEVVAAMVVVASAVATGVNVAEATMVTVEVEEVAVLRPPKTVATTMPPNNNSPPLRMMEQLRPTDNRCE